MKIRVHCRRSRVRPETCSASESASVGRSKSLAMRRSPLNTLLARGPSVGVPPSRASKTLQCSRRTRAQKSTTKYSTGMPNLQPLHLLILSSSSNNYNRLLIRPSLSIWRGRPFRCSLRPPMATSSTRLFSASSSIMPITSAASRMPCFHLSKAS